MTVIGVVGNGERDTATGVPALDAARLAAGGVRHRVKRQGGAEGHFGAANRPNPSIILYLRY